MVKRKAMEAFIVIVYLVFLLPGSFTWKKGRDLFYSEKHSQ